MLIGTTISGLLGDICAGAAGMLLHLSGKFTMGKLKSSLL
jgi:hypothetical protein